jgi:hypothetical protein
LALNWVALAYAVVAVASAIASPANQEKMNLNSTTQLMRYAVLDLVRRDQTENP